MILATTVAITPEIGRKLTVSVISSASKNVKCALSIVVTISTSSLFLIFSSSFENTTPLSIPKAIQPSIIELKLAIHAQILRAFIADHSIISAIITAKRATDVPSLNRLSHSKISASRFGAHTVLKILKTATGSVALISDAKSRHTKKGIGSPK